MFPSTEDIETLPRILPLFPLQGAVLLPRAQFPLHIFETPYLSMVGDAIGSHCLIGLVQPMSPFLIEEVKSRKEISLFSAGSAGRITALNQIEEGNILITLTGICRFDVVEELAEEKGYRRALVSYDRYHGDLIQEADFSMDRQRLLTALKNYFRHLEITPDWEEINKTSNEKLITSLAMVCPFEPREKQALLESPTLKEQSQLITTLIEMATLESSLNHLTCH